MSGTGDRRIQLSANMLVYSHVIKNLLSRIYSLETDTQMSLDDKFIQIKKIREEISKVGLEIDSIKKEIKLLSEYNVN